MNTDTSQKSNQHTPSPCMQVITIGTVLKTNPLCAALRWPEGLAEPERVLREVTFLLHAHVDSHLSPSHKTGIPGSHTGLSGDSSLCGRSLPSLYGVSHGELSWDITSVLSSLPPDRAAENWFFHHDEVPRAQELRDDLWAPLILIYFAAFSLCPAPLANSWNPRHRGEVI